MFSQPFSSRWLVASLQRVRVHLMITVFWNTFSAGFRSRKRTEYGPRRVADSAEAGLSPTTKRAAHENFAAPRPHRSPSPATGVRRQRRRGGEVRGREMSVRIKAVVDRFVKELKEALDADIQDRIMKEREMQSYIEEREREVAEREAAWKAELSRREVNQSPNR